MSSNITSIIDHFSHVHSCSRQLSFFCQVNFNKAIEKHCFPKPSQARIVRIYLPKVPAQEVISGVIPCIKVELHGIAREETGGKYLLFSLFSIVQCKKK